MRTNEKGQPLTLEEHRNLKPKEPISEAETAYWQRVKNPITTHIAEPQYTEAQLKNAILKRGETLVQIQSSKSNFVLDEHTAKLLNTLLKYFTKDPAFETLGEGFSLDKGIMLCGDVGRGKTLSLMIFTELPGRKAHEEKITSLLMLKNLGWNDGITFGSKLYLSNFMSCKEVSMKYSSHGFEGISELLEGNRNLALDDLGFENNPSVHYGEKLNVMEEVMDYRYRLFCEEGAKTHITTNLVGGGEFEARYGSRIRSRMRQMFNKIDIGGVDRRR